MGAVQCACPLNACAYSRGAVSLCGESTKKNPLGVAEEWWEGSGEGAKVEG